MLKNKPHIITPNWQAPACVKAFTTTRLTVNHARENKKAGSAYAANNLALHVGDVTADVLGNRQRLKEEFALPSEPLWLNQTHTTKVVDVSVGTGRLVNNVEAGIEADASYTNKVNEVSVVMTADCLPILLCDRAGTQVAAVHAGWRGLLNGIIENTIEKFAVNENNNEIIAWLGPAIGPDAFEVGEDVRDLFVGNNSDAKVAFQLSIPLSQTQQKQKWFANIYELARLRLKAQGVNAISGGNYCTYHDDTRFYSYRRDHICGRMATLIWLG